MLRGYQSQAINERHGYIRVFHLVLPIPSLFLEFPPYVDLTICLDLGRVCKPFLSRSLFLKVPFDERDFDLSGEITLFEAMQSTTLFFLFPFAHTHTHAGCSSDILLLFMCEFFPRLSPFVGGQCAQCTLPSVASLAYFG